MSRKPLKQYIVTMVIETNKSRPDSWDWNEVLVTEPDEHVSHVMCHAIYPEYISAPNEETNE